MNMSRKSLAKYFVLSILGMIVLGITPAFADATTLTQAQTNIRQQIVYIPKFVAVLAYVIGTFFAATALVKMKDWISEPEKNPINGFLVRMAVASLLILLPKILYMTNSTIFGFQSSGGSQNNNVEIRAQSMSVFK